MSSYSPIPCTAPATVWRDASGPGYAVGAGEETLRLISAAAKQPYRVGR